MQELEKILEEIIEQLKAEGCIIDNAAGNRAEQIIRKHMNDGWIPVEERSPEDGDEVLCCDNRQIYLVEYQADWDAPFGDLDGIIAWSPLPEPYHPEKK